MRIILATVFAASVLIPLAGVAQTTGKFEGTVVAEWLGTGREMRLTKDFFFVDSKGARWAARAGSVVDGASIPRFAWSLIGGPFEGQYRESSVIHDVACDEKKESWERLHEVFYEGMLASGVSESLASVMYEAVYHFGPRWERQRVEREVPVEQLQDRAAQYAKLSTGTITYTTRAENRRNIQVGGGVLASKTETRQVADLVVRSVPKSSRFKEQDFDALRARIEAEKLSPSQIRALSPQ